MPLTTPPDWAKVAVAPQVESLEDTSNSADGRVAVISAVRAVLLTEMLEDEEAVPTKVESAENVPVVEMVGVEAAEVERLAVVPKAVSVLAPLRAFNCQV